jgi:hypothetical protein
MNDACLLLGFDVRPVRSLNSIRQNDCMRPHLQVVRAGVRGTVRGGAVHRDPRVVARSNGHGRLKVVVDWGGQPTSPWDGARGGLDVWRGVWRGVRGTMRYTVQPVSRAPRNR